jgi:hypothetical protein
MGLLDAALAVLAENESGVPCKSLPVVVTGRRGWILEACCKNLRIMETSRIIQ